MRGTLRLLDRNRLAIEIATQLKAFVTAFGRAPDFVDGHQHVHLFPQVREPLLEMVKEVAPQAWVRQCGRVSARLGRPCGPQGAAARCAEPDVSGARRRTGHQDQSGVRRHLRFRHGDGG